MVPVEHGFEEPSSSSYKQVKLQLRWLYVVRNPHFLADALVMRELTRANTSFSLLTVQLTVG